MGSSNNKRKRKNFYNFFFVDIKSEKAQQEHGGKKGIRRRSEKGRTFITNHNMTV